MVVLAAPRGVFRRRQRDEWLGELADIRTDALGEHAAALDDHPAADGSQPPPEVLPPELAREYESIYRRGLAGESFGHDHLAHGRWFVTHGVPLRDETA